MVLVPSAEFGLHAGNSRFNTDSKERIRTHNNTHNFIHTYNFFYISCEMGNNPITGKIIKKCNLQFTLRFSIFSTLLQNELVVYVSTSKVVSYQNVSSLCLGPLGRKG